MQIVQQEFRNCMECCN